MRLHPAESRIRRLARETPAQIMLFDCLLGETGRAAGLIDGVTYPDEQDELIRNALVVDELNKVTLDDYARSGAVDLAQSPSNRIAVLYGVGSILRSSGGLFGGDAVLASDDFNETVRRLRDDESIDAVVLRIDSPGVAISPRILQSAVSMATILSASRCTT